MWEILLVVCMLSDPSKCHEERPPFQPEMMSQMSCVMQGQMVMVEWAQLHPGYSVRKWSCGAPKA